MRAHSKRLSLAQAACQGADAATAAVGPHSKTPSPHTPFPSTCSLHIAYAQVETLGHWREYITADASAVARLEAVNLVPVVQAKRWIEKAP